MGNIRWFNQPDNLTQPTSIWNWCSGSVDDSSPEELTVIGMKRGRKSGRPTPNFHRRVKSGELLPEQSYARWDYSMQRTSEYSTSKACQTTGYATGSRINHDADLPTLRLWGVDYYSVPNDIESQLEQNVDEGAMIICALAQITPDLDLLTTAVESRQTLRMILGARRRARDYIRRAMRGGFSTAKAASQAWLEWRYGWRTLGYDLENIVDLVNNPVQSLIVSGSCSETGNASSTYVDEWTTGIASWVDTGTISASRSIRARVIGRWNGRSLRVVTSIPITLWEVVPFSFVADWFVNVGDVLSAWEAKMHLSTIHSSVSRRTTLESTLSRISTGTSGWLGGGVGTGSEQILVRERAPRYIPSLVPSFNVNLTNGRVADAAAILGSRLL
jgi:hypothetical protein